MKLPPDLPPSGFAARVGVQGGGAWVGAEGPAPRVGVLFDFERRDALNHGRFLIGGRVAFAYEDALYRRAPVEVTLQSFLLRFEPTLLGFLESDKSFRVALSIEGGATVAGASGPLASTRAVRPIVNTGLAARGPS